MKLYKAINEDYFVQKRLQGEGAQYNDGYDDRDGHYVVLAGEEIFQRYTVMDILGKGSFGTVLKCFDERRQETVALKITRNGRNFRTQAKLEIDILLKLANNPALGDLVVRLLKVFDWKGHLVLVFELLSFNLYQLIKCTRFNGVSLDLVRKFGYQLIQVLHQMQLSNPPILHCDLKPENILLKNQNRSGIRVIDFGSACYENRRLFKYIQSRYYRSPEVILNLEYGTAIDRWSLGCVLVELHVGTALFDGRTEAQQLHKMQAVLGPLPPHMVDHSPKKDNFFAPGSRTLKELPQPINNPQRTLAQIIGVHTGGPGGRRAGQQGHEEEVYELFLDLVTRLLTYDPTRRISTADALNHPFLAPLRDAAQSSNPAPATSAPAPTG